ncbi:hypothetical protein LIER_22335 [Lithospermum erythrorhizon]|uniref:Uncharacterized protein n=1 Tax=Lithospermum erythrorhizon TaxID=34254 RepID=A0AAV3QWZ3_LITER
MMMMFEEMGFCGDLDFFPAPMKQQEVGAPQEEPKADRVVEDAYSDNLYTKRVVKGCWFKGVVGKDQ